MTLGEIKETEKWIEMTNINSEGAQDEGIWYFPPIRPERMTGDWI